MDLFNLQNLLDKIQGCTFATIDTTTNSNGITKVTTGERVILFTNKKSSGYENMVRRRLQEAGKDPDGFRLGDLPWGERLENSPIIVNKGQYYLQTISLVAGQSKYYIGRREVRDPSGLHLRSRGKQPGLPPGDAVKVSCYKLESIDRIVLMGETVMSGDGKAILPLKTQ
jgi:hypothetical protein